MFYEAPPESEFFANSDNFLSGQRVSLALLPCAVYFHGLCTDQQP